MTPDNLVFLAETLAALAVRLGALEQRIETLERQTRLTAPAPVGPSEVKCH
jgi:hypothetical protein